MVNLEYMSMDEMMSMNIVCGCKHSPGYTWREGEERKKVRGDDSELVSLF